LTVSPELQFEVERFLAREADLLDSERFREWFELLTEDVVYWIPGNQVEECPDERLSLVYEKHFNLETRVWRLMESGLHNFSNEPAARTMRLVGNVLVTEPSGEDPDSDDLAVTAKVLLAVSRSAGYRALEPHAVHPMTCHYELRRTDDGFRIASKRVDLLEVNNAVGPMTFIL
jgi:3-phenylpropionate/cinnamic acid dioxygenase small subunit